MSMPLPSSKPIVKLKFNFEIEKGFDTDTYFLSCDFKGMVNGGYMVVVKLIDPDLNVFDALTKRGFLQAARSKQLTFNFQILGSEEGRFPESATKPQTATILGFKSIVADGPTNQIEIVAIDPVSYALNMGVASGQALTGSIDQVIKEVVNTAGANINLDITKFKGNNKMHWYMMRQDPKSFILSILDWASSLTESRSQILVGVDGYNMQIKDQSRLVSRQRGFYRRFGNGDDDFDSIIQYTVLANSSLSALEGKLTTYGASSSSGFYLDRGMDGQDRFLTVADDQTDTKYVPKIDETRGFTKPNTGPIGGPPSIGYTAIPAIPELFSGGELGAPYYSYIDGRARNIYHGLLNSLMKIKLRVMGHGEFSDTMGLGADTIFIQMRRPTAEDDEGFMWVSGNWLVYGFHHRIANSTWTTDLLCARLDHDAAGRKVGV
jgi:hypothetical protein